MKSLKILLLVLLCLTIEVFAQEPLLDKKVSFNYQDATLEHILKDLGSKYDLKFSYVNNMIPLSEKTSLVMENITVKEGLAAILSDLGLEYKLINGQVVLVKSIVMRPAEAVKSSKIEKQAEKEPQAHEEVSEEKMIMELQPIEKAGFHYVSADSGFKRTYIAPVNGSVKEFKKANIIDSSLVASVGNTYLEGQLASGSNSSGRSAKRERALNKEKKGVSSEKVANEKKEKEVLNDEEEFIPNKEYDAEDLKKFHIGLVYPLSNHFKKSPLYINKLSFNALVGVSRGLKGVEVGGIGNIEKEFTDGVQIGGIFNVVAGSVEGVQVAGIVNSNKGKAGATQIAGIANVVSEDVKGIQIAGIVNKAKSGNGIQVAGITNILEGDMEGVQVAGIINKAKNVNGTQIGFINIADTVNGVSFGLVNIVKNGYRRVEVYGSEGFHTHISYKIGTRNFYTLIAAGANFRNGFTWGYGLGLGTQRNLNETWKLSIDATSYHVLENKNALNSTLSMNFNNLRVGIDKVFSRHFTLTFGPSFNMLITNHIVQEGNKSTFAPYAFYTHTGSRSNITFWPGFFIGFRI